MSDTPEGALSGIKVIDLSRVLGGPFCTQILADHGADVIKVEPPMGDETREWGPPFETDEEGNTVSSSYFKGTNRNKKCIALDLRQEGAKEILFRLLETADVLIENFKVGTLERWGMGYEEVLQKRFPQLIHCQITGFGNDGPLGGFPGYDAVIQAMSGLNSINGTPGSGPTRIGSPVVDLVTGLNAVIGINMALVERNRSGLGQKVESTLYDTGVSLQHPHAANWFMNGKIPVITGNAHPNVVPYDLFETRTRPIFLAVGNNGQFKKAMEVLGRPELADDPRFITNGERNINRIALTEILTELLADEECQELTSRFLAVGVPAGPANNVGEVLTDEHTLHRKMVVEIDDYKGVGAPVKLSRTPASMRTAPGLFAQDNHSVLSEAGYSDEEIASLVNSGAVVDKKR